MATVPEPVLKAQRWLAKERPDDQVRDHEIEKLQAAYDGQIWSLSSGGRGGGMGELSPTLQDVGGQADDREFRYSEVSINLVRPMVEDWKSVMGILPNIVCPPTKRADTVSQRRANLREKILQGVWADSGLVLKFLDGAHYKTLFGSEVVYVMPEPDVSRVRIRVRSPYRCHARRRADGFSLHHLAFDYEEDVDILVEDYPEIKPYLEQKGSVQGDHRVYPSELTVTEWTDERCRFFLVEDTYIEGMPYVEHGWGFVPGTVIPNIVGTDCVWGRSDAQQLVHLSQLISELLSMTYDATFQKVYDDVLFFCEKPITDISAGPFEALQLHQKDARVELMHQNLQLPDIQNSLSNLERFGRLVAGWPMVQSSEMDSSYVSGKAFQAAQGPVAARAAIKHIITALHYQRINSFALMLYEHHFPQKEISLMAVEGGIHTSILPVAAQIEPVTFVPRRDIGGQYENLLVFLPAGMDRYRQTIEWLQLLEAGVISLDYVREHMPGIDSEVIAAQIRKNAMEKAEVAAEAEAIVMERRMALQAQLMAGQMAAQQQAAGGAPSAGGGRPVEVSERVGGGAGTTPAASAPGATPGAGAQAPSGGGAGHAAPSPGGAAPSRRPRSRVTLAEAKRVFRSLKKIRGDIYLGGAIVTVGYTDGPIEVWLTEPDDGSAVISQTPYGAEKRLVIRKPLNGRLPDEPLVNVTPPRE